jgi:hypothetical protein
VEQKAPVTLKEKGVVSMEIIITITAIGMLIAGFSALYLNHAATTETQDGPTE